MLEILDQPVTKGVQVMIETEICESVLGHRLGYVKGLGFGPKLASAFKYRQTSSQLEVELEKKLYEIPVLM